MNENQIKILLIDFIMSRNEEVTLANEVPFYFGRRRVDLLQISNNAMHAFEIKSDLDTITRLNHQIADYSNTFEFFTIVTTKRHYRKIKSMVSNLTGLWIHDDYGGFTVKNKAIRRDRVKKLNLSSFLLRRDVIEYLNVTGLRYNQNDSTDVLRKKIMNHINLADLKDLTTRIVLNRYKDRFNNFLSERGKFTIIDDLKNLTLDDSELTII